MMGAKYTFNLADIYFQMIKFCKSHYDITVLFYFFYRITTTNLTFNTTL